MTLTVPKEFWPILQENRDLLHGMPTMAAEAIQLWAKDRYRVRILVVVVQQTFGGFLNFHPHLHIMVSAGGLQESKKSLDPSISIQRGLVNASLAICGNRLPG
jgi:hypothetical protein